MGKQIKISAIILSGSEVPEQLVRCKRSLGFTDEIIVVDVTKIQGSFSQWRNEGLKNAKGEWVLYVDTDEEVPLALAEEIQSQIADHKSLITAFAIPRKNIIFGKEFKHGGQYPDYQKRLFLRNKINKWRGDLHEEPVFDGELGHLNNPLIHHKDITISQMLEKTNKWSEIEAKLLFESNHPPMNIIRFATTALRELWHRFIRQSAYRDGTVGVIYGIYQIYSRLITYSKLWEMQIKSR